MASTSKPSLVKYPPSLKFIHWTLALFTLVYLILTTPFITPAASTPANVSTQTITLPAPKPIPVATSTQPAPAITAQSALVIDPDSGITLFAQNPDQPLFPASTTKIMTALIALETYHLTDVITVTTEDRTLGQTMKLVAGEQLTVKDLLYGALVSSGNDAALALAQAYPGTGYTGFVTAMNQKAHQLGLNNTHYDNVSGLESPTHHTTATDLAHLAQVALQNPTFKNIVSTTHITVTSLDGTITHPLYTTNELLGKIDGLIGVKTGWTEAAGECLVTAVDRHGHRLITVVLKSTDRFADSQALIDWAYSTHTWKQIGQAETYTISGDF